MLLVKNKEPEEDGSVDCGDQEESWWWMLVLLGNGHIPTTGCSSLLAKFKKKIMPKMIHIFFALETFAQKKIISILRLQLVAFTLWNETSTRFWIIWNTKCEQSAVQPTLVWLWMSSDSMGDTASSGPLQRQLDVGILILHTYTKCDAFEHGNKFCIHAGFATRAYHSLKTLIPSFMLMNIQASQMVTLCTN